MYALRVLSGNIYPTLKGVTSVPWKGIKGAFRLAKSAQLITDLKVLLKNLQPDLIHAGPIHDVAFVVAQTGFHPLMTMSWGFDLMKDVDSNPMNRWQTKYTLKRSDSLAVDCQSAAEKAMILGFPPERICKFPWGVDLAHFSPQNTIVAGKTWRLQHEWDDNLVLLCLRSWEPNYGVDILAKAFVKAFKTNPGLRLILLGDGTESSKVLQILEKGGVMDKVFLGGRVPNQDLITYYGAADVYISPSHVDGSSVSLMEAMACGLPAIVSDIPANLEWIRPSENGWVFPDGDVGNLAEKILLSAGADLRALGRQARQDAMYKADWEVNAKVMLNCYEQTLSFRQHRSV